MLDDLDNFMIVPHTFVFPSGKKKKMYRHNRNVSYLYISWKTHNSVAQKKNFTKGLKNSINPSLEKQKVY